MCVSVCSRYIYIYVSLGIGVGSDLHGLYMGTGFGAVALGSAPTAAVRAASSVGATRANNEPVDQFVLFF